MSLQPELPGNKLREALIHQIGIGIDFMIDGQDFRGSGLSFNSCRASPMELSAESIRIQKEIKQIFDPLQILNPGKIFQANLRKD